MLLYRLKPYVLYCYRSYWGVATIFSCSVSVKPYNPRIFMRRVPGCDHFFMAGSRQHSSYTTQPRAPSVQSEVTHSARGRCPPRC
eukprot:4052024-Prymnesium_polylepis.1